MPKTLLAVDDSATMRKVLEITFSGEDFRVITAEGSQNALSKMGEGPGVVIIDTSLGSDDGYALCKEVRRREPGAAVILLASRHNPYDQAKGRDAGADDYMDKPFDTQQMIDKVRKVLLAREGGATATPAAHREPAAAPAAPAPAPAPVVQPRPVAPAFTPQAPPVAAAAKTPGRGHTLMFGESQSPPPPAVDRRVEPTPAPAKAAPAMATPANAIRSAPAVPVVHAAAASVNGHLAGKLSDLGLSQSQVDGVLALSRDVVERVVWEVVPQLAEALIKEEIARLTKEG